MNNEMLEIMKEKKGFIAALDQSGGSSSKTLAKYGIKENEYSSEEEMFNLIHEMRKRVFTSKAFTNDKIIGAILFERTMLSKVDGEFTADYLEQKKRKNHGEVEQTIVEGKHVPIISKEDFEAVQKLIKKSKIN